MRSPPTRPALRARWDSRKALLVRTAATLFAERGFQATTIEDLSEASGLALGGIYHYIDGKDDLLYEICVELMSPLLAEAEVLASTERNPEEALRELVRTWVRHVEDRRAHMRVFQQERLTIQHGARWRDVRAQRKKFEQMIDRILVRAERSGDFAFADRRLALQALLAMINSIPEWYRPRGRLAPDEIADGYCDLLLNGASRPARGG